MMMGVDAVIAPSLFLFIFTCYYRQTHAHLYFYPDYYTFLSMYLLWVLPIITVLPARRGTSAARCRRSIVSKYKGVCVCVREKSHTMTIFVTVGFRCDKCSASRFFFFVFRLGSITFSQKKNTKNWEYHVFYIFGPSIQDVITVLFRLTAGYCSK